MIRIAAVFLIATGSLVAYLVWQQSRPRPFVVSGFVEADEIRIGSRVGGRVAEVSVNEGDTVKTGDPIFQLDPFELMDELARAEAQTAAAASELQRLRTGFRVEEIEQARARRDLAQASLDKLVSGPRPQEIEIAREQLRIAEAAFDLAESEYQRIARLHETQQAAPTEYDNAVRTRKAATAEVGRAKQSVALLEEGSRKEDIAAAKAQLAEADQALKLVEAGNRKEDIAAAEAQFHAAEAKARSIRVQIDELKVVSPCDCVVEAIDLRPGDIVAPNAPGTSLLDLNRMWVRAYVPETRLGDIKLEQVVSLRIIGMGDRAFSGRITFIARDAEFTPRNVQTPEERSKQVFRIKVTLDPGAKDVRVGMTADILFGEDAPS